MKKEKVFTTEFIAGAGILTAIEIVLYIIGANIQIAPGIYINLALIPIALGAIFYGPLCGLFLGLINGVATLLTPSTQAYFMNVDIFGEWCILGTFIVCLSKCTLAGLVSGIVYKALLKKNEILGIVLASLLVPIINTGIFISLALIFYKYDFATILSVVLSFNFLIEFAGTAILCPAIIKISQIRSSRLGHSNFNKEGIENEEK